MVISSLGRASSSGQLHMWRWPDSVVTPSCQVSRLTRGVGPADSTGKSSVRYCPGGSVTSRRPRPAKPRVMIAMSAPAVRLHEVEHFAPRPGAGVGVFGVRTVEEAVRGSFEYRHLHGDT